MHSTEKFQKQTVDALHNAISPCPAQVLQQAENGQSRRFNVYRNNRAVSLMENLQACYPAVHKLVGDEFFNAAARHYINEYPPESPVMTEYGESFGEFTAQLPGTAGIPYIADVARLEWACLQAYHQRDEVPISIKALENVAPEKLTEVKLKTHPAMALIDSRWPIGSIWLATVKQLPTPADFDMNSGEQVFVLRPRLDVTVHVIDEAAALFIDGLRQGHSLEYAAGSALEKDHSFDPGAQMQAFFSMGAFCSYI